MKQLLLITLLLSTSLLSAQPPKSQVSTLREAKPYEAKDFSHLIGMPGFSDATLNTHFKLYQGYVKNTNLLLSTLKQYLADGKDRTPEYAELKRRLGWEFDGMRLHEDYFSNLGGKNSSLPQEDPLYKRIVKDFGSYDKWKQDFVATGVMRGIGWVILYLDPLSDRLINVWVGEHDIGHLAGSQPILVMDVWEHAYLLDFGLERMDYINSFFNNIDWHVVQKRYTPSIQ